jgi:maleylacetate reductase
MSGAAPAGFIYQQPATRVVFGAGTLRQAGEEMQRLGCRRVLVLCTPDQRALAEQAVAVLGPLAAGIHDGARMHVPVAVVNAALAAVRDARADGLLSIGGGSTTGLGKMLALETALPFVAIPTTYAGSEVTPLYGTTQDGAKTTGKDSRVMPRTVIYDPSLTLDLPLNVSLASGMNALAHAAEGLYAANLNPVVRLMALEGTRALARALPGLAKAPRDLAVRADCLYGAWLCGLVLGNATMGVHHKICHVLGGFGLPHAEMHAAILPHALAYNARHAPTALAGLSAALGGSGDAQDAPAEVFALLRQLHLPTSLKALGMSPEGLDHAALQVTARPYPNPRPFDVVRIRDLLDDAFHGRAPHVDNRSEP